MFYYLVNLFKYYLQAFFTKAIARIYILLLDVVDNSTYL
jgi:hypothetical protein